MKKGHQKKCGFARTKRYPGKRHPAFYRNLSSDEVEYVTFTKHNPANINGKIVEVRELSNNINPDKRGKTPSNVVELVFEGKKSALHKNEDTYNFASKKDKEIVEDVFKTAPRVKVNFTSNSKHKK